MRGPTLLYHFVHPDTLAAIVASGELSSINALHLRGVNTPRSIANADVQERRAKTPVPTGGTLHDYVPFYFAPRSPMMYALQRGNLPEYKGLLGEATASDLVYLVTSAERLAGAGHPVLFSEGHPIMQPRTFYTALQDLKRIDWEVMQAVMWNNTEQDPDRQRRRQAEYLVRDRVPLSDLIGFAARDIPRLEQVQTLAEETGLRLGGKVKPEWYY